MLKEDLEQAISKGTRSREGIRPSVDRYRWNEITYSINKQGALRLKPKIEVEVERLSTECKNKIRTILQTREAKPTEICPFADISFGIRRIHLGEGPLRIEVTGDRFDKVPRVLTTIILEAVYGWSFEGVDDVGYLPTDKGRKRIKNYGLFYEGKEIVAVMYGVPSDNDCKNILVRRLKYDGNRRDKQILVEYKPAGRSDGCSRLGYRYFIDYTMFSSPWVKQKAIEFLTALKTAFNDRKYEPTLAQTKKKLMASMKDKGS